MIQSDTMVDSYPGNFFTKAFDSVETIFTFILSPLYTIFRVFDSNIKFVDPGVLHFFSTLDENLFCLLSFTRRFWDWLNVKAWIRGFIVILIIVYSMLEVAVFVYFAIVGISYEEDEFLVVGLALRSCALALVLIYFFMTRLISQWYGLYHSEILEARRMKNRMEFGFLVVNIMSWIVMLAFIADYDVVSNVSKGLLKEDRYRLTCVLLTSISFVGFVNPLSSFTCYIMQPTKVEKL